MTGVVLSDDWKVACLMIGGLMIRELMTGRLIIRGLMIRQSVDDWLVSSCSLFIMRKLRLQDCFVGT